MSDQVDITTGAEDGLQLLRAVADTWTDRWTQAVNRAVAVARANGATWADVGRRLGISRQAASQRFGWIEAGGVRLLRQDGRAWLEYAALPDERIDPRGQSVEGAWRAVRELRAD